MNRRDILKFFGAGTVIAPVAPVAASAPLVTLIEPPKVEIYRNIPAPIDLAEVETVGVSFAMRDGTVHTVSLKPRWRRGTINPGEVVELSITAGEKRWSPPTSSGQITARGGR